VTGSAEEQLSCEKFRREPATRWFDWSFAPIVISHERFARQHRFELPPNFRSASPCTTIVHHLSGPSRFVHATLNRFACTSPSGLINPTTHKPIRLLGPCFKTGRNCFASFLVISSSFHLLSKVLFIFPSRYLFAIGLSSVFSLGWGIPAKFGVHSQTLLLYCQHTILIDWLQRDFHPLWCLVFQPHLKLVMLVCCLTTLPPIPSAKTLKREDFNFGLLLLRSPLLKQSSLFSSPPLIDMLKSSGWLYLAQRLSFFTQGSTEFPLLCFE